MAAFITMVLSFFTNTSKIVDWTAIFKALFGITFFAAIMVNVGCNGANDPITRSGDTLVKEVIKPTVAKATDELSSRTGQLSGQGSLINPGYRIHGYAIFGTGLSYDFVIETIGVSANIAAATQADQGPDLARIPKKTEVPAVVESPKDNPTTKQAQ